MTRRFPRAALLLLLLPLAVLVLACGGDSDAAEPESPAGDQMTPAVSTTGTAPRASAPTFAKPPAATAVAAGTTVPMGIGTYCWSAPPAPGLCRDMSGPITGKQALPVQRGATVTVTTQFAGTSITSASVHAHDVSRLQSSANGPDELAWNFPPINGRPLPFQVDTTGVDFVADLAPGRYVVSVFLQVPEGDVAYGVLLEVR